MPRIRIFSTPECAQCRSAKAFFAGRGLAYEEVDVAADARGRVEMYELSRARTVPVIDLGGRVFIGFGSEVRRQIEDALREG